MNLNLRGQLNIVRNVLLYAFLSGYSAVAAGPVSTLYLTAGDQSRMFRVQGNTVASVPEVHNGEYALAVRSTVRTLNVSGGGALGNEYTLAGAPLAATYANTFGSQMIDGTTDGTYNYAVQWNLGTVIRFGLDWSSPTVVKTGLDLDTIGITYNPFDGTFWTASRSANTIFHYSSSFSLLGSFAASGATGLAFDPADGTLWAINQYVNNRLDQYSTGGTLLSSLSDAQLGAVNTLGAEFALAAVPEPTTTSLVAIGGLTMLGIRRRKTR